MYLITWKTHSGVSLSVSGKSTTFAVLNPPLLFLCSTARLLGFVFSVRHEDGDEDW